VAKKKKKAKKAAKTSKKKAAKKAPKKAQKKAPKKAAKKAPKKAAKTAAKKKTGPSTPMLPGMADVIESEEFEPEVGLVADDEEDDDVDFPEVEEITATPDLEKHGDDDEGEW
jgi:hypothetical protein